MVPDQPPEAVQAVVFVEDQVSVEEPPPATDVGFAASDTVGTVGAGDGEDVPPWLPAILSLPPQAASMRHESRRAEQESERVMVLHVPVEIGTIPFDPSSFLPPVTAHGILAVLLACQPICAPRGTQLKP